MIEIRGLAKTFHRGLPDQRLALDGVDLVLGDSEFAVVIGSNGAGKSTLLNSIAGEVSADAGTIAIEGVDLTRLPTHARAEWIARVFQDPSVGTAGSMTIEENLAVAEQRGRTRTLGLSLTRERRARYAQVLTPLGLGLQDRLGTKVSMLSGGQRQALALVMAVLTHPALLLLDEHTAALDPRTGDIVMRATLEAVAQSKLTTLMVTHNMQHAIRYGTRLLMMQAGRIVLDVSGAEKASLTVETLIERFHLTDDKLLLS